MKLVFFDDFNLGVVKDDTVIDVSGAVSGIEHTSPQELIGKLIEYGTLLFDGTKND